MRFTKVSISIVAALLAITACTEEQRRDVEGAGIRATLQDETESALDGEDIDIDELNCEADIDDDGIVTGSCEGTTSDGDDIQSELLGTVDVDEAECDAILTISVAGELIDDQADFDCLES